MNQDFLDILSSLSEAGAEYLVVGAHALAAHGYPRATGDLGIWVRPNEEDANCVWRAIERFGAPQHNISREDFHTPDTVFQIGVAPNRIDILTSISGVEFEQAWQNRVPAAVEGLSFFVLGRDELLTNKRATGRPKDLADAAWLESTEQWALVVASSLAEQWRMLHAIDIDSHAADFSQGPTPIRR